ncbi:molecular chaperone DnaJ [Xenophilus arseniciresistens]|uniref:Molecular chaperone DnaJ n=1 Tax=Xenophilus arseniciresistens TaxID=1283306 RepID=A0AAE3N891_9BURK|nr:molecular chaperone DnaJ [Xenophilus arseniciresistens]MDA7417855.1 molecular chaperone DnaJ [Xenophilus arseniciresistens]
MPDAPARRLHLDPADDGAAPPSAEQQRFARLHEEIAAQRALLAQWQGAIDSYEQRYLQDYLPVHAQYRAQHVALLDFLDHAASGGMRLGRTDAQALHALIAQIAQSLLPGEDDAARRRHLTAVHERYAPADEAAPEENIDDDTEALLDRMEAELDAARAKAAAAREKRRAERQRKGTTREQQAHRQKEEVVQATQSVRAVYRQLVSALHPDREPDEKERQRKTALMQRVNEAYAANRLLDLLQLQLEIAQIDAAHLQGLADAKLVHYNELLAGQLRELKQELRTVEADFKARHGLNPHGKLRPELLADRLRHEITKINNALRELQREQRMLEDPEVFKRWVKAQRQMG